MTDKDTRMVKLNSADGQIVELQAEAAKLSELVNNTINDLDDDEELPTVEVPKVNKDILDICATYLTHHLEEPMTPIVHPIKGTTLEEVRPAAGARFSGIPIKYSHDIF